MLCCQFLKQTTANVDPTDQRDEPVPVDGAVRGVATVSIPAWVVIDPLWTHFPNSRTAPALHREALRLRRDEAGLVGDHDELDAVARAQLREDAGDVRLDR